MKLRTRIKLFFLRRRIKNLQKQGIHNALISGIFSTFCEIPTLLEFVRHSETKDMPDGSIKFYWRKIHVATLTKKPNQTLLLCKPNNR